MDGLMDGWMDGWMDKYDSARYTQYLSMVQRLANGLQCEEI